MQLRVDVKDSVNRLRLETSFENNRAWMQQRIKGLAKAFKDVDPAIIDTAKDGTYQGTGEFDENDSSISEWNKLRVAIQKVLKEDYEKALAEAAQLKKSDLKSWQNKFSKYGLLFGNYTGMLDESEKLDKIWLWLQIKKEMEKDLSSRSENTQFMNGYHHYGSIDIPHFKSTMTSSQMKELFVTTHDLSEEAQGALCRRISIASDQESLLKLHNDIQNDFKLESTGFIESAPQHFLSKQCWRQIRRALLSSRTGNGSGTLYLEKMLPRYFSTSSENSPKLN
ncbi:hypothetical protein KI387_028437 [Taxus chinensis]|uniref:Uncharacterized protein n=1 Tax=Taxus chinensis TaxID=29808 RepID=A0AA38FC44_TAXCH|nr:hypothetical protein KI387_028437 [Taxus chinensis]